MGPTTDDLRALLDERAHAPVPPREDLTPTAQLSGVVTRVRRRRQRRAAMAGAAGAALLAGAVSLGPGLGLGERRAAPPANSTSAATVPDLPRTDMNGRPLAATVGTHTRGTRTASFTVVPIERDFRIRHECTTPARAYTAVFVNGQVSSSFWCDTAHSNLTRTPDQWNGWVDVGKPMTVTVQFVADPATGKPVPGAVTGALPETTAWVALYGKARVIPDALPMPAALDADALALSAPLGQGRLDSDHRTASFTVRPNQSQGLFFVNRCGGVAGSRGLAVTVVADGRPVAAWGCWDVGERQFAQDQTIPVRAGKPVRITLVLTDAAKPFSTTPTTMPLDAPAAVTVGVFDPQF